MGKWRVVLLVIAGLCFENRARAQYYFYDDKYYDSPILPEVGLSFGLMNSLTDLGGRKGYGKGFLKDLSWKVSRPAYGAYIGFNYLQAFSLRVQFTSGIVCSFDSLLRRTDPDLTTRYGRNLGFRSKIDDIQLCIEWYPLSINNPSNNNYSPAYPYVSIGLGYFRFNPEAYLNNEWYRLQPMHLEGQGFAEYPGRAPYSLQQFNLPIGIGLKYEMNAVLVLRFEVVHRILFTDYLDDVSTTYIDPTLFQNYLNPKMAAVAEKLYCRMQELQPTITVLEGTTRGDQNNKDAFFTIQLKVGWCFRERR